MFVQPKMTAADQHRVAWVKVPVQSYEDPARGDQVPYVSVHRRSTWLMNITGATAAQHDRCVDAIQDKICQLRGRRTTHSRGSVAVVDATIGMHGPIVVKVLPRFRHSTINIVLSEPNLVALVNLTSGIDHVLPMALDSRRARVKVETIAARARGQAKKQARHRRTMEQYAALQQNIDPGDNARAGPDLESPPVHVPMEVIGVYSDDDQ